MKPGPARTLARAMAKGRAENARLRERGQIERDGRKLTLMQRRAEILRLWREGWTGPEIGRRFGGRDHTTVLHAVRKIEALVSKDVALSEEVESLKRQLQE